MHEGHLDVSVRLARPVGIGIVEKGAQKDPILPSLLFKHLFGLGRWHLVIIEHLKKEIRKLLFVHTTQNLLRRSAALQKSRVCGPCMENAKLIFMHIIIMMPGMRPEHYLRADTVKFK